MPVPDVVDGDWRQCAQGLWAQEWAEGGGRQILPLEEGVPDERGDPHEHAEASEAEALLAEGLQRLTRLQREVFLLRAQQGLEYDDIAAALATTPGAARVHYHHAVRRLKEIVQ